MTIVEKAMIYARQKHQGQKYGDGDYFENHCMKVYEIIKLIKPDDECLQAAALLHDILEDTNTSSEELQEQFNDDIAFLVYQVTNPSKTKKNYFPKLRCKRAHMLKFADRLCNISRMDNWSINKQEEYLANSQFWKQ